MYLYLYLRVGPGEVNFEDKVEVEETTEVPEEQRMLMSGDSGNRGRPLLSRSSCSWNVQCTHDNDTKGYQVKPTMLNIPEYPRARSSPNEKYLKVVMMT